MTGRVIDWRSLNNIPVEASTI